MNDYTTYSSAVINGQMVPVLTATGMHPYDASAPQYAGRGTTPPTLPSGVGGGAYAGGSEAAAAAGANPGNLVVSPVGWLLIFLVVGMVGLRYVHWRG